MKREREKEREVKRTKLRFSKTLLLKRECEVKREKIIKKMRETECDIWSKWVGIEEFF